MGRGASEGFRGFPSEAISFFDGLEADNSKAYWQAHKPTYEAAVIGPLRLLLAELAEPYGTFRTFRPYRDVRFAKDKTPYKTHTGSVAEGEGGTTYYVELSAAGLRVGAGYYEMAADQLVRFRTAVADDVTGAPLAEICAELEGAGCSLAALSELKTAPRGIAKDHPRIGLLRRKGLIGIRSWPPGAWLQRATARRRITDAWAEMVPMCAWLDEHVGPSELPPSW